MHCNVGLAILVKVAPISDCFDGGTQSVSMVGTPVSLMPRSKRFAQVAVFDGRRRIIVQATANGFRMRPAAHHMRGARRTNSPRGSGNFIDRTWACAEPARTSENDERETTETALIRKNMMRLTGNLLVETRL